MSHVGIDLAFVWAKHYKRSLPRTLPSSIWKPLKYVPASSSQTCILHIPFLRWSGEDISLVVQGADFTNEAPFFRRMNCG